MGELGECLALLAHLLNFKGSPHVLCFVLFFETGSLYVLALTM